MSIEKIIKELKIDENEIEEENEENLEIPEEDDEEISEHSEEDFEESSTEEEEEEEEVPVEEVEEIPEGGEEDEKDNEGEGGGDDDEGGSIKLDDEDEKKVVKKKRKRIPKKFCKPNEKKDSRREDLFLRYSNIEEIKSNIIIFLNRLDLFERSVCEKHVEFIFDKVCDLMNIDKEILLKWKESDEKTEREYVIDSKKETIPTKLSLKFYQNVTDGTTSGKRDKIVSLSINKVNSYEFQKIFTCLCYNYYSDLLFFKQLLSDNKSKINLQKEFFIEEIKKGKVGFSRSSFKKNYIEVLENMEKYAIKPEIIDGIYTCGRCGCSKIVKISLQTSSGDEGTTVFLFCTNQEKGCKNRWKLAK